MTGKGERHLRSVNSDDDEQGRHPRDPEVWRKGLADARDTLKAARKAGPPPRPPIELPLGETYEPPEVLIDRAMAAWPDVDACRQALAELAAHADAVQRSGLARAVALALAELDATPPQSPSP